VLAVLLEYGKASGCAQTPNLFLARISSRVPAAADPWVKPNRSRTNPIGIRIQPILLLGEVTKEGDKFPYFVGTEGVAPRRHDVRALTPIPNRRERDLRIEVRLVAKARATARRAVTSVAITGTIRREAAFTGPDPRLVLKIEGWRWRRRQRRRVLARCHRPASRQHRQKRERSNRNRQPSK